MTIRVDVKVRMRHGEEIAMGPGKADLLDAIAATGSISGAARSMKMSYRRAWLLVDVMNRTFREPLVVSAAGGAQGGGAGVTDAGRAVLTAFRAMEAASAAAVQSHAGTLAALLRSDPGA
ncbi:MAG: LysR family transcriptional regulator [Pseudomonadota bacterium]|nr:LysR family transcriptional regulator [Pseudomonadota bacterium]